MNEPTFITVPLTEYADTILGPEYGYDETLRKLTDADCYLHVLDLEGY